MFAYRNRSEESFKEEDRTNENKILGYVVCSCVMKGN